MEDIRKIAEEFKATNSYILEGYLHMCQADLEKHRRCFLDVQIDNNSYTDGKVVHLGLLTAADVYEFIMAHYPDLDPDAVFAMINEYLLGHENQHTRSTRNKDFMAAQSKCKQALCHEISRLLGDGKVFRSANDYDEYIAQLGKDYKITKSRIERMCHNIANCIEDGRIERIRSVKRPGFGTMTRFVRAAIYEMHSAESYLEEGKYTPATLPKAKALCILLNQCLSLSTASVYEKDFFKLFSDTEIGRDASRMIPFIRAGVNSGCCRGIVAASEGVVKIIAPYLLEAIQKNEAEDQINKSDERMQETGSGNEQEQHNTVANEEETDDGQESSVVSTPDGEEALNENKSGKRRAGSEGEEESGKNGEESGEGSEDSEDGSPSGNGKKSKKAGKNGNGGSGLGGEKEGEDGKGKKAGESENSSESSDGDSNSDSDGDPEENGDAPTKDGKTNLTEAKPNKGKRIDNFLEREAHGCDDEQGTLKALEEAMKNAASQMNGLTGQINTFKAEAKRKVGAVKETKLPEFKPKATNTVFPGIKFKEVYRKYKLDTPMPYDLQVRADKFANDIEELFHNQEIPEVRCMNNGKIDPSGIYKLGLNMIDCFEQDQESPEFSGCTYFLCDNSGSMGYGAGSKRYYANTALSIIEQAFTKHMPVKMAAFDEASGMIIHEVLKNWDEDLPVSGAYNFAIKGRGGCGNADAYSIRVATEELLARPEEEKMLVVMSDGAPACVTWNGKVTAEEEVRAAVEDARAAGIRVISIFFDTCRNDRIVEAFHFMYGKYNSIICDPEYIEDELAELMQTFVFG